MLDGKIAAEKLVYGRRRGRPLRVRKSHLMEDYFPRVKLNLTEGAPFDVAAVFAPQTPTAVWLEVGFGGGEHLAAQAQAHPDYGLIGCEPFVNGVASLLDHLEREQIENVRVYDDDARRVFDLLPDASLGRVFVLFADPWPKKRHADRRFIGPENLARIARVLKNGGMLRLASDHPILVDWMRGQMAAHTHIFACTHDSTMPPDDWVPTRYQEKAVAAGRVPVFMDFHRI